MKTLKNIWTNILFFFCYPFIKSAVSQEEEPLKPSIQSYGTKTVKPENPFTNPEEWIEWIKRQNKFRECKLLLDDIQKSSKAHKSINQKIQERL